jgi:potassium inwardly-rectifying channel subfamily J, other
MNRLKKHIKNYTSYINKDELDSPTHTIKLNKKSRLVQKCGELNIQMNNVPKHKRRLLSDLFNTIIDIKWRWHLIVFILSFLISWLLFAFIWYLVAYVHGDLSIQKQEYKIHKEPCVHGVNDFTSAFLYSIETQHTIGYGHRHITRQCSFAIFILMIQSCFGIFVQGLVAGLVFAKLSRPNKRRRTIIFSNNACISNRDNKLCFMFKIGNIRISQLSDAQIKLLMIRSRYTNEGEYIPFQTYNMKLGSNIQQSNESIFFPWPQTIEHIIDEESPLYDIYSNTLTSNNLNQSFKYDNFEIVVILEGNIETTGASCHIRTSYLPNEILWGYRFTPIIPKFNHNDNYLFDYSIFNQVEQVQENLVHINSIFNSITTNTYSQTKLTLLKTLLFKNKRKLNDEQHENEKNDAKLESIFKIDNDKQLNENKTNLLTGRFVVVPVEH